MKKSLRLTTFLLVALMGLGLASCKSVKPIENTQLTGYWVLKTMEGKVATDEFEAAQPSLEFDFDKKTIHGSGGCNRYTGGYTLTPENEFSASALGATMMMCMHKNSEGQFLKLLSAPKLAMEINEKGLLTFSQGDKVILQFEKGVKPSTANTGVRSVTAEALTGNWTLKTLAGEDISKLFGEKIPTITFADGGKVAGNGGCNNYRTTYTLTGNTIQFTPVMSTKMACPNMEGESKFIKHLETPLQSTINGETLTLLKEGNVVLEFTKTATE